MQRESHLELLSEMSYELLNALYHQVPAPEQGGFPVRNKIKMQLQKFGVSQSHKDCNDKVVQICGACPTSLRSPFECSTAERFCWAMTDVTVN